MNKVLLKLLKNSLFKRLYLKIVNKNMGRNIEIDSIHFKDNIFHVSNESTVKLGIDSYMIGCNVSIEGSNNKVIIGNNCVISSNNKQCIRIIGDNNRIIIGNDSTINLSLFTIRGNNCVIKLGSNFSCVYTEFFIGDNNCNIAFGKDNSVHGRNGKIVNIELYEETSVKVGNDCMFSNEIEIRPSDAHSIVDLNYNRMNKAENIVIGNHVWICMRTMLLKGTQIGSNSVIGAGTICNKKFSQENVIIAGNPAKIVKTSIEWDRSFI